jgi:hypothetical protein
MQANRDETRGSSDERESGLISVPATVSALRNRIPGETVPDTCAHLPPSQAAVGSQFTFSEQNQGEK